MIKAKVKIEEQELVQLVKAGSEMAFTYLYDNYSAALFGVIVRIVIDEDRAHDVLQETFIKIWKSKDSYESAKGTIFTWMLNIGRNSAIDSNRSKHVKYKSILDEKVVNSELQVNEQAKTDNIGLKETILKLKIEYQRIIEYIYIQGFTQQEFSDEFNIPLGTVKTRTRAALQDLRVLLA